MIPRKVDLQINAIDFVDSLPDRKYLAMHSTGDKLVVLTTAYDLIIFKIKEDEDEGIRLNVMKIQ